MNNNGNSSLKTFVLVAASLAIVGSLIYSSTNVDSLESKSAQAPKYKQTVAETKEEPQTHSSPFKKLAEKNSNAQAPAVLQANTTDDGTLISGTGDEETTGNTNSSLAATTNPTQSTTSVPNTGGTTTTIALMVSGVAFFAGLVFLSRNPRKIALSRFEKNITKKL